VRPFLQLDYPDWMDQALCRGLPSSLADRLFFPDVKSTDRYPELRRNPRLVTTVEEFCAHCPVLARCRHHGAVTKSEGIWGGAYFYRSGTSGNPKVVKVLERVA
jgi:hypothetical protein